MTRMNTEAFYQTLRQADRPVLVEFHAPWCVYCRRLEGAMTRLEQSRRDLTVLRINIDEHPELAEKERIEVVPTLVVYEGGQSIGSIVAPESRARIEDFLTDTVGM